MLYRFKDGSPKRSDPEPLGSRVHPTFTRPRHDVCDLVAGRREVSVLVLVRHAHAGSKRRWPGPDEERPLSPRGRAQALHLAALLADLGVTRLLSSPALRCRQTLAPASEALWVPVEPLEALSPEAPVDGLLRLLESPRTRGAALCTHGETLHALSRAWEPAWRQVTGSPPPDLSGTAKGACWVIEQYGTPQASVRSAAPAARR
jgi:phosphohistidine phosphatase SixA